MVYVDPDDRDDRGRNLNDILWFLLQAGALVFVAWVVVQLMQYFGVI